MHPICSRLYTDKRLLLLANLYLLGYHLVRVCLDPKFLHPKTLHGMFGHMHRVLNEVYLQFFLHGWTVNRETNLMSLRNS